MSTQCIVVLGTASVQRYIFQSNRLKEIIGASYLAKYWFEDGLIQAIHHAGYTVNVAAWHAYTNNPSIAQSEVSEDTTENVTVIYIGGGNAALLCRDRCIATKVVRVWSRQLIENAPELRVVVGYGDVTDSFANAYHTAWQNLNRCEEALPFGATLGSLPVVRSCRTTGLPASMLITEENNVSERIAQSAATKRKEVGYTNQPGRARKHIAKVFESVLGEGERFAIELDKELGASEGQSYIAVVHADGNGIGELFMKVVSNAKNVDFLHHIRAFSASVSTLSQSALENTLQHFKEALPLDGLRQRENIFPLRPIVYGGDDLTFVCDGRVGLHLAAHYLQEFAKGKVNASGKCESVDACAGVAIVHTKFPIAQAYHFADELCGLAKTRRREENEEADEKSGSWLDFQIIQEGITGSVSMLRSSQYRSLEGQMLHQRPYELSEEWGGFIEILQAFRSRRWPRSRAKGLLQVLTQGPTATQRFIEGAHWRGTILPDVSEIDANAKKEGWTGGNELDRTTPYFDPLEALDFYLDELLLPAANDVDEEEAME